MGRSWTLLTGERGAYELAAGRDPKPFIYAMEKMASDTALLPEQVWDAADIPQAHMYLGKPTGSAMPLMWAHAEYIKLLRSLKDRRVFDLIPEVAERYLGDRSKCKSLSVWKFNRQVQQVKSKDTDTLRIIAIAPFKLHWTWDDWQTIEETSSSSTNLAIYFVDIPIQKLETLLVEFTFFWSDCNSWEGQNYKVTVRSD